jgi:hypothetical protein
MAALVLTAGLGLLPRAGTWAQDATRDRADRPASEAPKAAEAEPASPDSQAVKLKLLIAGLGRDGCDVEVKPGNRSCKFKTQVQHVGSPGELSFQFKDVEVRGADRNCTFAITVREAGQSAKTIYRGFRLPAHGPKDEAASVVQSFTCFMNSPSKLADLQRTDRTRQ